VNRVRVKVTVSRVSIRVRVRVRVRFMVWVRGNVREGKCPTLQRLFLLFELLRAGRCAS